MKPKERKYISNGFVFRTYAHLYSLSAWGEDPHSKNRLWVVLFWGEKPEPAGGPEDEEWG